MTLIDRNHLNTIFHDEIKKTSQFIRVRNIEVRKHDNSKYIELDFYIHDKKIDDIFVITHFKRKIHIINDFKTKMLIDMNIMKSKKIILNFANKRLTVKSCEIIVFLTLKLKKKRVDKIMRITAFIIISFFIIMFVSVKFRKLFISQNRNYMFHFQLNARFDFDDDFCFHIADVNIIVVQVRNAINRSCVFFKNVKVNRFRNYEKQNYYFVQSKNRHLTIVSVQEWKSKMKKFVMLELVIFVELSKKFVTSLTAYSITFNTLMTINFSINDSFFFSLIVSIFQKRVMSNNVTIYNDFFVYNKLFIVTKAYFKIWKNFENTINIFEKNWMSIFTIFETKSKVHKVYSLSSKDKAFVNKKFDKFYQQSKMKWTIESTLYDFSCFVMWKIVHLLNKSSERKKRVIINIRELNKIFDFDVYSMQQQVDIITVIMKCFYIFVMNAVIFFSSMTN